MPQLDSFTYISFFKYSLLGILLMTLFYFLYQAKKLGMEEVLRILRTKLDSLKAILKSIREYFGF